MSTTYDSSTATQPLPITTEVSRPVTPELIARIVDRIANGACNPDLAVLLIERLAARDQLGRVKYKKPLETFNRRSADVDALEEILDAAQYAQQRVMEGDARGDVLDQVRAWAIESDAALNNAGMTDAHDFVSIDRAQLAAWIAQIDAVLPRRDVAAQS